MTPAMIEIEWPIRAAAQLAFAHVLLAWVLATYGILPIDATWKRGTAISYPRRRVLSIGVASAAPLLCAGLGLWRGALLAGLASATAWFLDTSRRRHEWLPVALPIEVCTLGFFVAATMVI